MLDASLFLFIPIPRAASATVAHELAPLAKIPPRHANGMKRRFSTEDLDLGDRPTAAEIRAAMGPEAWTDCFVFAFTRSPYARAYSICCLATSASVQCVATRTERTPIS